MNSKAPLYTFIPLPSFPHAKVNSIFAWSTKDAWPHISPWEHWWNAALTYHSTGSSVRLQGGVRVPCYRCVKPTWTSLNSVDRMRHNKSHHINKTFHLTPKIYFFFHKVPSINFKMVHFYWDYSSVLTVWKSGTAFPLYRSSQHCWKSIARTICLEWRWRRMCLFWFSFSFFFIFKSSLIFPREVPRLINTHPPETETQTRKNRWTHNEQHFKFPSDKIPYFNWLF